jgi:hypothetical protein
MATGDHAMYGQVRRTGPETTDITKQYESDMAPFGKVTRYMSDGAKELIGSEMQAHAHAKDTPHAFTWIVAEHSNFNPLAEGALWTIFCMVRAMLEDSGMPQEHWAAAAVYASYIYRRTPKLYPRLDNAVHTPYAMLHRHKAIPTLQHIKLFGCKTHGLNAPSRLKSDKLGPRTITGYFVG